MTVGENSMTQHLVRVNRHNGEIEYQVAENGGACFTTMPLKEYWKLRRRKAIAELRYLDRMLGKEQTIPERVR